MLFKLNMTPCLVITLVFIVAKLMGVLDWSWWWVLVPFWFPFAALTAVIMGAYMFGYIRGLIGLLFK